MNTARAEHWPKAVVVAAPPVNSSPALTPVTEEVLTPEQFFTAADRSKIAWTPERRLLLAVLEDAVGMFLRYRNTHTTRGKRLFRETQAWFTATDRTSLCAFETICDYLHLDADYLRLGLRRLPEPTSSTPSSASNLLRHLRHGNSRLTTVPTPDRA